MLLMNRRFGSGPRPLSLMGGAVPSRTREFARPSDLSAARLLVSYLLAPLDLRPHSAILVDTHVAVFTDVDCDISVNENIMRIPVMAIPIIVVVKIATRRIANIVDINTFDRRRFDLNNLHAGTVDHRALNIGRRSLDFNHAPGRIAVDNAAEGATNTRKNETPDSISHKSFPHPKIDPLEAPTCPLRFPPNPETRTGIPTI
jgi:hypothetical protein